MSEKAILVFSDDSQFRADVIAAIGSGYTDGDAYRFIEVATAPGGMMEYSEDNPPALCVLDGETKKEGAMSFAHNLAARYENLPPLLFIVARPQDEWLARGAGATQTLLKPIDALKLSKAVVQLLAKN